MKPLEFSIKQPLFVNLLCIFLVLAGIVALKAMHRDLFPNVSYDTVIITTVYDGATPRDMEKLITIPLEKELKEVDDIEEMTSASIENFSVIAIKIDPDTKNKDKVVTDIQRAVDSAKDLPVDLLEDPAVREIKSKDIPVVEVTLSSDMPEAKLQQHAKVLEELLLDMPEVSAVNRGGWRDQEIWVEVDTEKMAKYHIAVSEVMKDLARRNVSMPGGKLVREKKEYLLRTGGEFETVEEVGGVIIRANDAGHWVRVRDFADVSYGFEEEQAISKTNGKKAIKLVVVKRQRADAINLVDKIKVMVAKYESEVKDAPQISLVNDYSYYVKRRLKVLIQNGFLGIIFVIITLLLFLNPRVATVTAVGIPIAFMITFFVMLSLGININLISLFGLILVLGMLVDDAIVISENVYRYVEQGLPYKEAAIKGVGEVWRPVTSTVLTTIAAFMPLMFMTGLMGKFVWSIPVVVIIALSASLLQALFILPSHLAEMGRIPKINLSEKFQMKRSQNWLKLLTDWYVRVLEKAIKRRYAVAAGVFLLLVGTVIIAKFFLPVVLFPARGIDNFFVRAKLPVGTPLEVTEEKFRLLEELIGRIPADELDDYVTEVGIAQNDPHDPFTERASHLGQIAVFLKPSADRDRETKEIIEDLRESSKSFTGFEELSFDEVIPGPPVGRPIVVKLRGDDLDKLDKISKGLEAYLATIKGVLDIKSNYEQGKGEWQVVVNEGEAAKAGLSIQDIGSAVRFAFDGGVATKIKKADEEITVRVRFPYESKYDETKLSDVKVENERGNLVPLDAVASFVEKPGVSAINHLDRRRAITVTANVDQDVTTSLEVTEKIAKEYKGFNEMFPGYTITFGGEFEETEKSMSSLGRAFMLAVALIFLILATNFKSITQPFIVMMAIPFGLIGVVLSFLFHGMALSFLALLGTVGLSGVVVNSSIILVDFINSRRASGEARLEAIIDAGRVRIRPVLLTTITTVAGLFPVAYGLWGSDPILIPAALALMWGLVFATALTLLVIPCFYAIMDDIYERASFLKFWKNNHN